jgi:hypothetical protein
LNFSEIFERLIAFKWKPVLSREEKISLYLTPSPSSLSFLLHCFVACRCSQLIWFGTPKPLTLPDWSLFDEGDKDAFPLERMFIVPAPPSPQSLRYYFTTLSCLIPWIILFSFYFSFSKVVLKKQQYQSSMTRNKTWEMCWNQFCLNRDRNCMREAYLNLNWHLFQPLAAFTWNKQCLSFEGAAIRFETLIAFNWK